MPFIFLIINFRHKNPKIAKRHVYISLIGLYLHSCVSASTTIRCLSQQTKSACMKITIHHHRRRRYHFRSFLLRKDSVYVSFSYGDIDGVYQWFTLRRSPLRLRMRRRRRRRRLSIDWCHSLVMVLRFFLHMSSPLGQRSTSLAATSLAVNFSLIHKLFCRLFISNKVYTFLTVLFVDVFVNFFCLFDDDMLLENIYIYYILRIGSRRFIWTFFICKQFISRFCF